MPPLKCPLAAATKLRNCPTQVTRFDQLVRFHGIGEKLANKILEIIRTGELAHGASLSRIMS